MQSEESWYEERAMRYDESDDSDLEEALQAMERHDRERKTLRWAKFWTWAAVVAVAFGIACAFVGLPYVVRYIIHAITDTWSWL